MASNNQIQERIDAFARQLCEELGDGHAGKGVCWLDAIENESVDIGDAVVRALVKQQAAKHPVTDESAAADGGTPHSAMSPSPLAGPRPTPPFIIHRLSFTVPSCSRLRIPNSELRTRPAPPFPPRPAVQSPARRARLCAKSPASCSSRSQPTRSLPAVAGGGWFKSSFPFRFAPFRLSQFVRILELGPLLALTNWSTIVYNITHNPADQSRLLEGSP